MTLLSAVNPPTPSVAVATGETIKFASAPSMTEPIVAKDITTTMAIIADM